MNGRDTAMVRSGIDLMLCLVQTALRKAEQRPGVCEIRRDAARDALDAVTAAGGSLLALIAVPPTDAVAVALATIVNEPGTDGMIACPVCAGPLRWTRSESGRKPWLRCETADCLAWTE